MWTSVEPDSMVTLENPPHSLNALAQTVSTDAGMQIDASD
jgi:hypothetical protein